jgi:hypothetical protein
MTVKRDAKVADKGQGRFNKVAGNKPKNFKDKKVGYANREDTFLGKRKSKDQSKDNDQNEGANTDKKNAPKAN